MGLNADGLQDPPAPRTWACARSSGGLGHAPFQDQHRCAERLNVGLNGCVIA